MNFGAIPANAPIPEAAMALGATGLAKGSFSAYFASGIGPTNTSVVLYNAEEWDVSDWYDETNGRFTPQVAGYYRLTARLQTTASSPTPNPTAEIWKNSVVLKRGERGAQHSLVSALVVANGSTDYFTINVPHSTPGNLPLPTGVADNYFQGELVGRS